MKLIPVAALGVAACWSILGCGPFHRGIDPASLAGTWHVVEVSGAPAVPANAAERPTIRFSLDSARVSGNGGCNTFRGSLDVNGEIIDIKDIASTRRACADAAMNSQELLFIAALDAVNQFGFARDTMLLKRGEQVRLRFVR